MAPAAIDVEKTAHVLGIGAQNLVHKMAPAAANVDDTLEL